MTPAPNRRWFAYSLRTLFVAVTVFACVIAWIVGEVRFVNQRWEMRAYLYDRGGHIYWYENVAPPATPFWRKWLGDFSGNKVGVPDTCDAGIRSEVMRLFPESEFWLMSPEGVAHDSPYVLCE
jgi:hypothetical protein